jgi:hypothetical protein
VVFVLFARITQGRLPSGGTATVCWGDVVTSGPVSWDLRRDL